MPMPMSLAHITGFAINYGAVALTVYAATLAITRWKRSQTKENALDEICKSVQPTPWP